MNPQFFHQEESLENDQRAEKDRAVDDRAHRAKEKALGVDLDASAASEMRSQGEPQRKVSVAVLVPVVRSQGGQATHFGEDCDWEEVDIGYVETEQGGR